MAPEAASIVTYRTSPAELRHVLGLLSRAGVNHVYVVDNASSAEIRSVCGEFREVEYIPSRNVGYGAGHNIALRRSLSSGVRYHLVLNTDVDFNPADLGLLTDYLERNPAAGCVAPRLVCADGAPQYAARLLPTPTDLLIRRFLPSEIMKTRRHRYELRMFDGTGTYSAPFLFGSFMLLRAEALRRHGIFDERFFLYMEDVDFTRRLHRHWHTVSVPFVTVRHEHRAESYHSLRMLALHCVSAVRYFTKWGWFRDDERSRFNDAALDQFRIIK